MAAQSSRREVTFSRAALEALQEIWLWNAEHNGARRADGYLRFLELAIEKLAPPEVKGQPVPGRSGYRYLRIQRRSHGHGHVAVFQADSKTVIILRIFHTAQDWQRHLDPVPTKTETGHREL